MAGFHTKTFIVHDDYMTPNSAWDSVKDFLPRDKVIWEAFYGDGKSGEYLSSLGFNVIHKEIDFFTHNEGDIIVSNPPFSQYKNILKRLKELDKPFMIILPCSKICTSIFRENCKDSDHPLQIIIPRRRIQFIKNGAELQNKCNFDCFFYCYKMGLKRDIIWLD